MPELTIVEKDQLKHELQNHIINCILNNRGRDTRQCESLSRAIMRSIGSRREHFPNGDVFAIYKKHFNESPDKVYEYIVRNYSGLLDDAGIEYEPVESDSPSPSPSSPAPAVQAGPDWMTWVLMGGAVLTGIYWIKNR